MYSIVNRQIPEFIEKFLVYCDCFIDVNEQKTCWVLTRNLKFFEFCQKQLVATMNLHTTCLSKLKTNLENYKGPKGKWCETSNILPAMAEIVQHKITLGKYVFHALNVYKIYVIIQCWDKCVVLQRLPDFKGFEIKAEYEDLLSYRIVHGTIKYCPVLELKFQNNEILITDFEDKLNFCGKEDLIKKKIEMRHMLDRIRCAKTELQLHKSITGQSFYSKQNSLTFGEPFLRHLKFEKQILGRCGDIWKRFTANDDFIIGVPLVNQCIPPNLSIIRNLKPVLQSNQTAENCIQLHYLLFQLKIKFDQLDELETYIESEDEQLQEKIWCSNGDLQILPESFVVLLIKLKISQIISLKESPLILNYEVIRHLNTTSDTTHAATYIIPLQLFLQHLDFHKFLFEERSLYEVKFLPHTLHQDFLTIAMTSTETNLRIIFKTCKDIDIFENFIEERLDFLKPMVTDDTHPDSGNHNSVFYNNKASSLWFGSLILRMKKLTEDKNYQCLTTWRIYCQNFDKTLLLVKTLLSDQLTLQCNVVSISSSEDKETSEYSIIKFENALRQELLQLQEVVNDINNKNYSEDHIKNVGKLYQLQMNSDIIASDVINN